MAIEMEVPKDITQYQQKFIGPFSARQLKFVVPGALLGIGAYMVLKNMNVSTDTMIIAIGLVMLPFLACGYVDYQGLPIYKFLYAAAGSLLAPKKRLYKTENEFQSAADNFEHLTAEEQKARKKAKNKKSSLTLYK